MVERSELPPDKQPHLSIYGKLACYSHGVSPYPPTKAPEELKVDFKPISERSHKYELTEVVEKPAASAKKDETDASVAANKDQPSDFRSNQPSS